jgi:hypothetical protein
MASRNARESFSVVIEAPFSDPFGEKKDAGGAGVVVSVS